MCAVLFWEIIVSPPPSWPKKSDLSEGANTVCSYAVTQIPASVENCFEQKLLCLAVVVDSVTPASVGDPEINPIISCANCRPAIGSEEIESFGTSGPVYTPDSSSNAENGFHSQWCRNLPQDPVRGGARRDEGKV